MKLAYYRNQFKKIEELTALSAEKQQTFLQQILIVSSSILGILVALHKIQLEARYIRWVFVLAVLLLALVVLCTALALFVHTQLVESARQAFCKEVDIAMKEDRPLENVGIGMKKRTLLFEKTSLICFVASLILLGVYTVLISFT
jgi:hypothetical protein